MGSTTVQMWFGHAGPNDVCTHDLDMPKVSQESLHSSIHWYPRTVHLYLCCLMTCCDGAVQSVCPCAYALQKSWIDFLCTDWLYPAHIYEDRCLFTSESLLGKTAANNELISSSFPQVFHTVCSQLPHSYGVWARTCLIQYCDVRSRSW